MNTTAIVPDTVNRPPSSEATNPDVRLRTRATETGETLIGLEVARFACAVAVLFWHYQHFYQIGLRGIDWARITPPGYALFAPFYRYGWLAVPVFWCLSGFIFFHKYARPIAERGIGASKFALLRFSRLYPLHLATLLAVLLLQSGYAARVGEAFVYPNNNAKHFLLQLFMASDWGFQDGPSFNGPIWSVSVEVVVYVLFFGLTRVGVTRPWMLGLLLGTVGLALGLRWTESYVARCLFFFYLGALTSVVYDWSGRSLSVNQRRGLFSLALLSAPTFAWVPGVNRIPTLMLAAPLAPLVILFLLETVNPKTPWLKKTIVVLGNATYSSYLLHFPLQLAIVWSFAAASRPVPTQSPLFLTFFFVTTFVLGVLVYRHFERPAQDYLRRLARRSS